MLIIYCTIKSFKNGMKRDNGIVLDSLYVVSFNLCDKSVKRNCICLLVQKKRKIAIKTRKGFIFSYIKKLQR